MYTENKNNMLRLLEKDRKRNVSPIAAIVKLPG